MTKVLPAFVCVDGWNERPDASGNAADSSLRGFAQEGLQRMKDHLDWIDPGNTAADSAGLRRLPR